GARGRGAGRGGRPPSSARPPRRLHENGHRLAAAQRNRRVVDAHGDRIAAERTLVQDLDLGAFDEPELEQTALELGRGQAMRAFTDIDRLDSTAESTPGLAQWRGWRRCGEAVFHSQSSRTVSSVICT